MDRLTEAVRRLDEIECERRRIVEPLHKDLEGVIQRLAGTEMERRSGSSWTDVVKKINHLAKRLDLNLALEEPSGRMVGMLTLENRSGTSAPSLRLRCHESGFGTRLSKRHNTFPDFGLIEAIRDNPGEGISR